MDYPKSVPGVGLVGGKFVDENTATGQQGSLIPSVWGNAVTEEIRNVIKDAGDVPAEGDLSQLQKAIRKIVALVWPKASDAEVAAGLVDDKVVTPKKLRVGWSASLGTTGFVALPTWLGGFVFQWGRVVFEVTASVNTSKAITFPVAFPSAAYVVLTTPSNSSSSYITTSSEAETRTGYTLVTGGGLTASSVNGRYFAVGV